jgi:hypothetical protein
MVMYYAVLNGCESWVAMLSPVDGNHGVICRPSCCESRFVMVSQWLWIMVYNAEPVAMNHGVLCWASGHGMLFWSSDCVSWCDMLSQWLCIMVWYSEPVVVNHGVLFWAGCGESWCAMLSPVVVNGDVFCKAKWLWIMMCYAKPSGWESWCVILS